MRWLIWAITLMLTNGSGTLASRARNTPSYGYHAVAALFSHGCFFVAQLVGLDILVEVLRTHDVALAAKAFACYALTSTTGSVLMQYFAIRFLEKGNRRVGGY